jgi:hypothetical protein
MNKKLELTKKQMAAWNEFKEAVEKCHKLGIDFIDQFDGYICAVNGKHVEQFDYHDDTEEGEELIYMFDLQNVNIEAYRFGYDDAYFGVKFK